MKVISIYIDIWDYLLEYGLKTINIIDTNRAWDYKIMHTEFSILETFNHTIQAIYEDTGTWFLKDSKKFIPSGDPEKDLRRSIKRMKEAIQNFNNKQLKEEFSYQWGKTTTIETAIKQNIFHTISHFGQLRERVGILKRTK